MSSTDKNNSTTVACDGQELNMGHPKIYLKLSATDCTICPYCSKNFSILGN